MTDQATPTPFEGSDGEPPSAADLWCSDALDGTEASPRPSGATDDRLHAFESAAHAIGDVPELDEFTRNRLVRAALAAIVADEPDHRADLIAPRTRRTRRWYAPAAAVASAAALVGGALALQGGNPATNVADSTSGDYTGAQMESEPPSATLPDLGNISDLAQLRGFVVTKRLSPTTEMGKGADVEPDVSAADNGPTPENAPEIAPEIAQRRVVVDEVAGCVSELNPGGPAPELFGTGLFEGKEVVVAVVAEPGRTLVWVLDESCTPLATQQFSTA